MLPGLTALQDSSRLQQEHKQLITDMMNPYLRDCITLCKAVTIALCSPVPPDRVHLVFGANGPHMQHGEMHAFSAITVLSPGARVPSFTTKRLVAEEFAEGMQLMHDLLRRGPIAFDITDSCPDSRWRYLRFREIVLECVTENETITVKMSRHRSVRKAILTRLEPLLQ